MFGYVQSPKSISEGVLIYSSSCSPNRSQLLFVLMDLLRNTTILGPTRNCIPTGGGRGPAVTYVTFSRPG